MKIKMLDLKIKMQLLDALVSASDAAHGRNELRGGVGAEHQGHQGCRGRFGAESGGELLRVARLAQLLEELQVPAHVAGQGEWGE